MIPLQNRGERENGQIVWLLFNHRIEFGIPEFRDILFTIRNGGLFVWIDRERPALRSHIEKIIKEELASGTFDSDNEVEFYLEQCLLTLADRVDVHFDD